MSRDHGHILTGDLRFIKNKHLRNKEPNKGPNFWEARAISWNRCKDLTTERVEYCSQQKKTI